MNCHHTSLTGQSLTQTVQQIYKLLTWCIYLYNISSAFWQSTYVDWLFIHLLNVFIAIQFGINYPTMIFIGIYGILFKSWLSVSHVSIQREIILVMTLAKVCALPSAHKINLDGDIQVVITHSDLCEEKTHSKHCTKKHYPPCNHHASHL